MTQREILNEHAKEKIKKLGQVAKTAKISWDTKNLVIRVPNQIKEALSIKQGEEITFVAEKNKLIIIFRGETYAKQV